MSEILAKIEDAVVIASGWQPNISKIENSTLVSHETHSQTIHERVIICDKGSAEKIGNKSSLVSEILFPATHCKFTNQKSHVEMVLNWCKSNLLNDGKTIAVRCSKIGVKVNGWSGRTLEQEIGGKLFESGWKINLTKPDITLRVIAVNHEGLEPNKPSNDDPALIWGVKRNGQSTWDDRTAPKRPFFKPISLDPRLARSMVNISCPEGGKFLDPFCGTGGILLEASEVGLQVYGSDADFRMVEGSKENLQWSLENQNMSGVAEVRRCSATKLNQNWGDIAPFDGFAFDPPYGLNSWKSDDGFQLLEDALRSCAEVATENAKLTALLPLPPSALSLDLLGKDMDNPNGFTFGKQWNEVVRKINQSGWEIDNFTTIPVHRSLARLLIVCKRNSS